MFSVFTNFFVVLLFSKHVHQPSVCCFMKIGLITLKLVAVVVSCFWGDLGGRGSTYFLTKTFLRVCKIYSSFIESFEDIKNTNRLPQ